MNVSRRSSRAPIPSEPAGPATKGSRPSSRRSARPIRCCTPTSSYCWSRPRNTSLPIGGVSAIFDRNLNTNTALGLDVSAPQTSPYINRLGLPTFLPTVSLDVNLSSGTYDEGYAVGTMNIRYFPSGKRTPGVFSQGKAIVTIHAQIYTANVGFILRNANIDP